MKSQDQCISLGEPDQFLDLTHASLPYWKRGQGPDLLFFHGWPFDSRIWSRVVARLEDSYTCHLFDLPFAGLSRTSPQTPTGLQSYVEAAKEAMLAMDFGAGKIGYIGHDSGGSVARLVAASSPDRVSGLVLGNTEVPNRYSAFFRGLLALAKWPLATTLFSLFLRSRRALDSMALVGRGADKVALNRELQETYFGRLRSNRRALENAMFIAKNICLDDFDSLAEAQLKITAPVRLLWGAEDPWFPLSDAETMLTSFGGPVELRVVDEAALMVHEEAPEDFASLVREVCS